MEPEGSLSHSQKLVTCSCSEPDQSSPHPPSDLWRFLSILSSRLRLSKTYQVQLGLRDPEDELNGHLPERETPLGRYEQVEK